MKESTIKEMNQMALSAIAAIGISAILGALSLFVSKEYGAVVFVLIPFLLGFLPNYIVFRYLQLKAVDSYGLGMFTLMLAFTVILIFALEGLVCIAMASPILVLLVIAGVKVARMLNNRKQINHKEIIPILAFVSFVSMSFDYAIKNDYIFPITTSVVVNAPIEKVWNNVVTFDKIPPPTDFLFSTGIAYPKDATIKGKGVGAIRYCNFSTGSFVEPITTWDEPNLLQFTVKQQPIPMFEYNPFWDNVHPPHLDGYFKSHKGQFKLTKISATQTLLEGTTWYSIDLSPEFYWAFWSEYIIHAIHERVLNHIKNVSEDKNS